MLKATSFVMPDEKKKRRVVVGGESSRRSEGSGATPDVGVSVNDQSPPPPDRPIVREAVVSEEARRPAEDKGREVDGESEIISVGGPLGIAGGCESEGLTFEEAVGRAGLISETESALYTSGLPIC